MLVHFVVVLWFTIYADCQNGQVKLGISIDKFTLVDKLLPVAENIPIWPYQHNMKFRVLDFAHETEVNIID